MSLLLDRFALFYPMRLALTAFLIVVVVLHAQQFDEFGMFYYALVTALVVYPHLVYALARKHPQNRQKIEVRTFLVDAFLLGLVVHAIGFTALPTFVLMTVALASSLSVNGLPQMLKTAAGVVAGVAAYALFVGVNFDPKDSTAIDVASSAFMFVYFMAFAYSSHNRSALLLRS